MKGSKYRTKLVVAGWVALAGAAMMPTAVNAQAIHACVTKAGAIRISASCKKAESALTWNAQGAQGPAGPVGSAGPQGPAGPPGPAGMLQGTTANLQQLNIVNASSKVLATLGPTADGNVLTFFDSGGKKTLTIGNNAAETVSAGIVWDNNKIVPGSGIPRLAWGEVNPSYGAENGFGMRVFDASGNTRTGLGTSFDFTDNNVYAINADGSSEGIGSFSTGFDGYYVNDATTPTSRQFGGLSFDSGISDYTNEVGLVDTNGMLRVSAAQVPADFVNSAHHRGNAFVIWDQNGLEQASMSAFVDGSLAGFNTIDPNNQLRFGAFLTPTNGMNVHTYDASGNVTGHVP